LIAIVRAVSNVQHSYVGSSDAAFNDDPEDPDYEEEPVEEFEEDAEDEFGIDKVS